MIVVGFAFLTALCVFYPQKYLRDVFDARLSYHLVMDKDDYLTCKKDYRDLIPRYLRLIVVVTYLVLPSVTTTIFGAFTTVNIDPEGLVPGMPRYLRNDYAVAENTARYSFGFAWAVVMIFVYVFVLSILFFLFVWVLF